MTLILFKPLSVFSDQAVNILNWSLKHFPNYRCGEISQLLQLLNLDGPDLLHMTQIYNNILA